jgi:hypothetical protein
MDVSGVKNLVSSATGMFIIEHGLMATIAAFLRPSKPRNQNKSMRNTKNILS